MSDPDTHQNETYEVVFSACWTTEVEADGRTEAKERATNQLYEEDPDTGDLGQLELVRILS